MAVSLDTLLKLWIIFKYINYFFVLTNLGFTFM